jgi:tetratricopeptide (TPR) repeat protein
MATKIENSETQARLTATVGEIYNQQGKFDDSLPLEKQALEIAKQINTPYIQVHAHNRMADAYLGKGMLPKALEHAQMALDISKNHQVYPYYQAEALNAFGEIYLQQKQTDNALRSFEEALSICNSAQVTSPKLRSLRGIGTTYSELGRKDDALTYLRQAREIYKNAGVDSPDSRKIQDLMNQLSGNNSIQK